MIDWANLTWTCHVCGRERPDSRISVWTTEKLIGNVPIKQNVRYCNDNPVCLEGAHEVEWVKGAA